MRAPCSALGWVIPLSYVSLSALALGQASDTGAEPAAGSQADEAGGTGAASAPVTVEVNPVMPAPSQQTVIAPYGFPQPGADLNAHLPSSSRAYAPGETDTFDLHPQSTGPSVVQGTGEAILLEPDLGGPGPVIVPEIHVVRNGDTLWDLSGRYYSNPWNWPRVWSYNPQVKDPHWIYPGDQLRLRPGSAAMSGLASTTLDPSGEGRFAGRQQLLSPGTIVLRDQGYIGDPQENVWGELVGAREDQMLLSEGNEVYMLFRPGVELKPGQQLTIFRPVRKPPRVPGARRPPGELVKISGTVRIDHYDPSDRVARGRIIESLETIERGAKLGPLDRAIHVVPPKRNQVQVWARVLTSLMPLVYMSQNQVVFIDKGEEDGLEAGNRLRVLRRGDTWRRNLKTASRMARDRLKLDTRERVDIETTPLKGDDDKFPFEVVGELLVLKTERYSSIALVTQSRRELVAGDRALAPLGY